MNLQREKILNCLHYLSGDTIAFPSRLKILKLLYFIDFVHFRERGRSITGLQYHAWDFGPIPRLLWNEWTRPNLDFRARFKVVEEDFPIGPDLKLEPHGKLDQAVFSSFEWDLIVGLADRHFRDEPWEMVDELHFENGPWDLTWEARKQHYMPIPYDVIFGTDNKLEHQARRNHAYEKHSLHRRYQL